MRIPFRVEQCFQIPYTIGKRMYFQISVRQTSDLLQRKSMNLLNPNPRINIVNIYYILVFHLDCELHLDFQDFRRHLQLHECSLFESPRGKTNNVVSEQVPRHKPSCSSTEAGQKLEISDLRRRRSVLSL